jgi:signal transduction histidine kinase
VLAHASRPGEVLPRLHQRALDITGGSCSLLFERNPRTAILQATSALGVDGFGTEPWHPGPDENAVIREAFRRRQPTLVGALEHHMPELAIRLASPSALLFPLVRRHEQVGLLVVGFKASPQSGVLPSGAAEISDGFLTTLELFRSRHNDRLFSGVRELLDELVSGLPSTLNLSAALDRLCEQANRLFGAERTSLWLHDRRTRHLVLQASSDPERTGVEPPAREDDPASPAAAAARVAGATIHVSSDDGSTITVPLRGCRRALGAMVLEGVHSEPGGERDLLDRINELGRQLAGTIENTQLLDDLIRSRRELENTFDSIAHLVVVADRNGRIVRANDAFASRVNQTRASLVDKPLVECIGTELVGWLTELEEAGPRREGQAPASREVLDPLLNGPFMVTVTDLLNHDRERVGRVIVARDLTPQSRLEAEREELRERLTQSDKLAALGQFVAGIAHELNNPLQGVLGHLELLRVTGAFPKHLRREVQTIHREADRAARIVRNLLVFAGSRRLARRNVSLNAVLHKIIALRLDACRAQQIELVRHYNEKLPRVQSDPLLLHQVFLNMVMNAEQAISATGKPGRIEIRTTISASGDRIIATVRDTGKGIPPDSLTRIFEPFYSTKEVGKGTGLGLAIAYGIVQEHGGQIAAANHPDGGAMFTVELPIGSRND